MQISQEDEDVALNALQSHLQSLLKLCQSITACSASLANDTYQPPVIDRTTLYTDKGITGLAKFQSLCQKELDHHLYLLKSKLPLDSFSSNAPFLSAVWREVMISPKPIVELSPQMPIPKRRPFKFDVVSANGTQWHKINTITKQRLLAEISEADSSDDDSSISVEADRWSYISIVRQCLDMREASFNNPVTANGSIRLVFRLTRLCQEEQDARIQLIYAYLRSLGMDLKFGDPAESEIEERMQATKYRRNVPIPSVDLNLDLSMLVALISDISHSPLPATKNKAEARFQPVRRVWKRKTSRNDGQVLENRPARKEEWGPEEHSRALIVQLQQEMESALIPELIDTITSACNERGSSPLDVRFWTTREAMERCLMIATKIAGPRELARAHRLFQQPEEGSVKKLFWSESRHKVTDGPFKNLHVRLIDDEPSLPKQQRGENSFSVRLESTCQMLIGTEGVEPLKGACPMEKRAHKWPVIADNNGHSPKKPSLHTIRSMLAGTEHGMTTITANRMSVKQIVRIMGLKGLASNDDHAAFLVTEPKTLAEQKRTESEGFAMGASIWTFDPRSLAEAMVTGGDPVGDHH